MWGENFIKHFFKQIDKLLSKDGVSLIHTIGSVNPPRDPHPWITKYIFPWWIHTKLERSNCSY